MARTQSEIHAGNFSVPKGRLWAGRILSFLPALFRRDGYAIGYVDVIDRPRHAGKSNYGLWDRLWVGILDLAGVWWLIRRRKRVPQVSEV